MFKSLPLPGCDGINGGDEVNKVKDKDNKEGKDVPGGAKRDKIAFAILGSNQARVTRMMAASAAAAANRRTAASFLEEDDSSDASFSPAGEASSPEEGEDLCADSTRDLSRSSGQDSHDKGTAAEGGAGWKNRAKDIQPSLTSSSSSSAPRAVTSAKDASFYFRCKVCLANFPHQQHAYEHLKREHRLEGKSFHDIVREHVQIPRPAYLYRARCHTCKKVFEGTSREVERARRHAQTEHGGSRGGKPAGPMLELRCRCCQALVFSCLKDLKEHIQEGVHNIKQSEYLALKKKRRMATVASGKKGSAGGGGGKRKRSRRSRSTSSSERDSPSRKRDRSSSRDVSGCAKNSKGKSGGVDNTAKIPLPPAPPASATADGGGGGDGPLFQCLYCKSKFSARDSTAHLSGHRDDAFKCVPCAGQGLMFDFVNQVSSEVGQEWLFCNVSR